MRGEVRARRVWDDGGESGMHGEGPTQGSGARALAEHTSNMERMSVTLDVSKLSGWLNAYARCRVERRARAMWGEVCGPGGGKGVYGGGGGSGMHGEGPTQGLGVRARAERTWNMYFMFPTLDVSKLSGWLNACAPCAKSKGGRTMWGEVCGPGGGWRRGAVGQRKSGMHGEGPTQGLGARARAERTP